MVSFKNLTAGCCSTRGQQRLHSHCKNPSSAGQRKTRTVCTTEVVVFFKLTSHFVLTVDGRVYISFIEVVHQWSSSIQAVGFTNCLNLHVTTWLTQRENRIKKKKHTTFLCSSSLAPCYHSFHGASGSFKRNFTGTKWFYCVSLINRDQRQLQTNRGKKLKQFRLSAQCFSKLFTFSVGCAACQWKLEHFKFRNFCKARHA